MRRTTIPLALAATFAHGTAALAGGDRHMRSSDAQPMHSQQGVSSDTIRQVQQVLQDKGHNVGPIDGIYGPKTASALREFQRDQGLSATGRVDQQTLASLSVNEGAGTASAG